MSDEQKRKLNKDITKAQKVYRWVAIILLPTVLIGGYLADYWIIIWAFWVNLLISAVMDAIKMKSLLPEMFEHKRAFEDGVKAYKKDMFLYGVIAAMWLAFSVHFATL